MTVKETYHADCLRIKQLEQQLARYQKFHDYIVQNEQWINDIWLEKFIKEFESEQNER